MGGAGTPARESKWNEEEKIFQDKNCAQKKNQKKGAGAGRTPKKNGEKGKNSEMTNER